MQRMLRTLLAVTVALVLVFGISGMAGACDKDIDCDVDCSTEIELCKSITGTVVVNVGATVNLTNLGDKNVNDICQTFGDENYVGDVTQIGLGNYSDVCQEGSYHTVGNIYQETWGLGYNVSTVLQWSGDSNFVGNITQLTPAGGYNVSSVVQEGNANKVGNIFQSS